MKKLFLGISVMLFALVLNGSSAMADACGDALKKAAEKAAKDKDCQKDAKNVLSLLSKQIQICKDFRKMKQKCRAAKQASIKACQGKKGKEKRECKQKAREEKRDCKDDAKNTAAYAVCKDARKLTNKAAGNFAKCTGKYFLPAVAVCVAQLFSGD